MRDGIRHVLQQETDRSHLPLDAINAESAREKSIRHGHPALCTCSAARRPLSAAVLFAQMVDDPYPPIPTSSPPTRPSSRKRERLFRIIEELVKWENINNEPVLEAARHEIASAPPRRPPPVLDPFAGSGSSSPWAQRLDLEAHKPISTRWLC